MQLQAPNTKYANSVMTSIVESKYHGPAPEVIKCVFLLWLHIL